MVRVNNTALWKEKLREIKQKVDRRECGLVTSGNGQSRRVASVFIKRSRARKRRSAEGVGPGEGRRSPSPVWGLGLPQKIFEKSHFPLVLPARYRSKVNRWYYYSTVVCNSWAIFFNP